MYLGTLEGDNYLHINIFERDSNLNHETDDRVGSIEDHSAYFDSAMIGGQEHALKRTMRDFVGAGIN